jgi:hypothetical protein
MNRRCVWCGLGDVPVGLTQARKLLDDMAPRIRPDECARLPYFFHMVNPRPGGEPAAVAPPVA